MNITIKENSLASNSLKLLQLNVDTKLNLQLLCNELFSVIYEHELEEFADRINRKYVQQCKY